MIIQVQLALRDSRHKQSRPLEACARHDMSMD
jgi:hypothetical protein